MQMDDTGRHEHPPEPGDIDVGGGSRLLHSSGRLSCSVDVKMPKHSGYFTP